MKVGRIPLMCVFALFATVASTTSAYAATTFVIVLLDATGSMSTQTNGQSRFQLAADKAAEELNKLQGDVMVDVYTFRDLGTADPPMTEHTGGFVPPIDAASQTKVVANLILCVGGMNPGFDCNGLPQNFPAFVKQTQPPQSFPVVPNGVTPLADAMCTSFDRLTNDTTTHGGILIVSSDGLENASKGDCHGDLGAVFDQTTGWPLKSWQQNVINRFTSVTGNPVHVDAQVFLTPVTGVPFGPPPDVETGLPSRAPAFAISAAAATGIDPLQQFFLSLAQAVGGRVRVFTDNQPAPLFGDVNGGQCVDITDAIDVARAFGQPAFGSDFDLNVDGKIGFDDYQLVTQSATPGCGTPNPFTPRNPVVCKGAKRIVIDGQSIADGGITIDARGACDITIRTASSYRGRMPSRSSAVP